MKIIQVTKILLFLCISIQLPAMDEKINIAEDNEKTIELTLHRLPDMIQGFELIRLVDNRYPTFEEFLQENLEVGEDGVDPDYGQVVQEAFVSIIHAMHLHYIPRFITSNIDIMQENDPFIRFITYVQQHRDGFMVYAIPKWMREINLLGETLLHKVVMNCNSSTYRTLLSFGADINAQNNRGRTPLHVAVMNSYHDEVVNLMTLGANFTMQDIHGKTPLHHAISNEDQQMIHILLQAHANTQIADNHGDNAFAFAARIGNDDIKNMIQAHNLQLNIGATPMQVFDFDGNIVNAGL